MSDDVFVERVFELGRGRKARKVVARFSRPAPDPRGDYACAFTISGLLPRPIADAGFGVDGIQALRLAMECAAHQLLASRPYRAGRLTFLGSHDLQLPIPRGSRILVRWDLEAERLADSIRGSSSRNGDPLDAALAEVAARPLASAGESAVLVERELELRKGKRPAKVVVRFRTPVPDRWGFRCALEIEGLGVPIPRSSMLGVDGVDALQNAMKLAMAYVLPSAAYQQGRLTWHDAYDLGLPADDPHVPLAPLIRRDLDAKRIAAIVTRSAPQGRRARSPRRRPQTRRATRRRRSRRRGRAGRGGRGRRGRGRATDRGRGRRSRGRRR